MPIVRALRFEQIEVSKFLFSRPPFTIIAGENGSGKSRALRALALEAIRQRKKIIAVSSSAYHRFNGLGATCRVLAPRRAGSTPESILKNAIRNAQDQDEIQLRSISRVLRHCGYSPAVGFRIEPIAKPVPPDFREKIRAAALKRESAAEDLESAIFMLNSIERDRIEWMNFDGFGFEVSTKKNLSRLLFWEDELIEFGLISRIKIFLQNAEGDFFERC